ncbi:MAG: hypothetical protein ACTS53_00855 [Candidatus Hodgkinia cicadicola]
MTLINRNNSSKRPTNTAILEIETRKFKRANEYSFALTPLEDLFNDSPLNSKIGKLRGKNITLIYELNLEQIAMVI